ncbi:hypothetical protein K0M31_014475 [Melipona bicolor]|uniref:Uncharacterized protein n=1 Tax=Melipona bicolor TaxID=60889 RepID=A0AA40G8M7_9HYME|nr:hypothetical protein K0M31_014475 [Melipona bicolor]
MEESQISLPKREELSQTFPLGDPLYPSKYFRDSGYRVLPKFLRHPNLVARPPTSPDIEQPASLQFTNTFHLKSLCMRIYQLHRVLRCLFSITGSRRWNERADFSSRTFVTRRQCPSSSAND